jgi:hypothetical protein
MRHTRDPARHLPVQMIRRGRARKSPVADRKSRPQSIAAGAGDRTDPHPPSGRPNRSLERARTATAAHPPCRENGEIYRAARAIGKGILPVKTRVGTDCFNVAHLKD